MDKIKLIDFIYELGLQKKVKRSGWWVAGVKDPETVAEHSHRAAIIAYIIAKLEKADAEKAACLCMIHDISETRINDAHKIVARYMDAKAGEDAAFKDQLELLPDLISQPFGEMFNQFQNKSSPEGIIAKDADYLECAFQAKEYLDLGYASTTDWLKNIDERLKTKTAKDLFATLVKRDSKAWFIGLKKLEPIE